MKNQRPITPLEQLIADRQRLTSACAEQEQKMNETFSYIQENSGKLLLSGISMLLFPGTTEKKGPDHTDAALALQKDSQPASTLNVSDYMAIGQSLLPIAWNVARPLLTAWGVQKVQYWLIKKLFKKKK